MKIIDHGPVDWSGWPAPHYNWCRAKFWDLLNANYKDRKAILSAPPYNEILASLPVYGDDVSTIVGMKQPNAHPRELVRTFVSGGAAPISALTNSVYWCDQSGNDLPELTISGDGGVIAGPTGWISLVPQYRSAIDRLRYTRYQDTLLYAIDNEQATIEYRCYGLDPEGRDGYLPPGLNNRNFPPQQNPAKAYIVKQDQSLITSYDLAVYQLGAHPGYILFENVGFSTEPDLWGSPTCPVMSQTETSTVTLFANRFYIPNLTATIRVVLGFGLYSYIVNIAEKHRANIWGIRFDVSGPGVDASEQYGPLPNYVPPPYSGPDLEMFREQHAFEFVVPAPQDSDAVYTVQTTIELYTDDCNKIFGQAVGAGIPYTPPLHLRRYNANHSVSVS